MAEGVLARVQRLFARLTSPQAPQSGMTWSTAGRIPGVRLYSWHQALQVPSVWRCVNLISQSIAMVPWSVLKRDESGRGDTQPTNPVHWLLHNQPNDEMSAFTLKQTLLTHALGQGNGYAEIQRNRRGTPIALWLIDDPDRVTPGRLDNGKIAYKVQQGSDGSVTIPADDMFHVRGLATDGIIGLGVLDVAKRSIAVSIALEQMMEMYFRQGMRTPGFLKTKGKMNIDGLKSVIKLIKSEFTGLQNFEMPIPLDADMEFQAAGSNFKDAQFLELRRQSDIEICRLFGVPPHLIYDLERATFSNIESQDQTFLTYGLLPRIVPMEQEADRKLLTSNHGGLYSKMNVNAFARGDMAARGAFYQQMRNMGVFTVNDILRREDMSTIGPEGDVRVMQVQYQPTKEGAPSPEGDEPPPPPKSRALLNGVEH